MKKIITAIAIGAALLSGSALAQNNKAITDKIKKEYPQLNVESAAYIPSIKLYEVKIKDVPSLSYTNEQIDFFLIAGELVDPKTKKNVSRERELVNAQKFFKDLPFKNAISVKYGKGTRQIAVFTDPDCPYCKQLDQEIHSKLTKEDITIHYFMNPLNIQGHEQAPLKAKKIWCSANKGEAWVNWMTKGQLPNNNGSCANPVDETKQFATKLGFNSTPIMIFDNGFVARQALSAEQIKQLLSRQKP